MGNQWPTIPSSFNRLRSLKAISTVYFGMRNWSLSLGICCGKYMVSSTHHAKTSIANSERFITPSNPCHITRILLKSSIERIITTQTRSQRILDRLQYPFIVTRHHLHKLRHHLIPISQHRDRFLTLGILGVFLDLKSNYSSGRSGAKSNANKIAC